jgi:NADH dehydrogenase
MKILVAGGSGFIGRAVVEALLTAGHQPIVMSRTPDREDLSPDIRTIAMDVTRGRFDDKSLDEVDAVINLVGISRPRGKNTFERAHVVAVRRLVEMCRDRGINRFVHVSVVRVAGARGAYQETKARGEGVVEGSGLDWTIIRPALVYGPDDDAISSLVELIRVSSVFPVPGGPPGMLQVVDVRDVAEAVVRCLDRPQTSGKVYDIVGPEKFTLAELVGCVSAALSVKTWTPALPVSFMRVGAAAAQLLLPKPPVTRAQIGMLISGLHGDPDAARKDLDLEPRRMSRERLNELAADIEVRYPSLRLVPDRRRAESLASMADASKPLAWLIPLALVLMLVMPWFIEHLWMRAAVINATLLVLATAIVRIDHRAPWRLDGLKILLGLVLGLFMFGVAQAVVGLLGWIAPGFLAPGDSFIAWAATLPAIAGIPALVAIAALEDAVWRYSFTMPLAARFGPWQGAALGGLAFGLAHATSGPLVLVLAAIIAGFVWSGITIRTRSLVVTLTCHVAWDLLMIGTGL